MVLSAATSAATTVAAMGYSLEVPDWVLVLLLVVWLFSMFLTGIRVFNSFLKDSSKNKSNV